MLRIAYRALTGLKRDWEIFSQPTTRRGQWLGLSLAPPTICLERITAWRNPTPERPLALPSLPKRQRNRASKTTGKLLVAFLSTRRGSRRTRRQRSGRHPASCQLLPWTTGAKKIEVLVGGLIGSLSSTRPPPSGTGAVRVSSISLAGTSLGGNQSLQVFGCAFDQMHFGRCPYDLV